jgi:hypothetical protein
MDAQTYEEIRKGITTLEHLVSELGLEIAPVNPLSKHLEIVKSHIDGTYTLADPVANESAFRQWYLAMLSVGTLTTVVNALQKQPSTALEKLLRLVLSGDISQTFKPTQAKDFLYELQVAYWFHKAGFSVEIGQEPDLWISGHGLSKKLGIACKYPSSKNKLDDRISKGYDQLEKHNLQGIVAVGFDLILCGHMRNYIRFPNDSQRALNTVAKELNSWVEKTIARRAGAGRRPLENAMFSLVMGGFTEPPARLQFITQFALICKPESPLRPDFVEINKRFATWATQ